MPTLGVAFAVLPESLRVACEYDRQALAAGEVWRLWTAHLVHFSARHAFVDLLVLTALGSCIERRQGARSLASLFLCAPPLLSLALHFFVPDLAVYRGASALCVAFGTVLGMVLWRDVPAVRVALLGVAGVFAFKLVHEAAGDGTNFSGLRGDIYIVWQAHVFGAVLGVGGFAVRRYRMLATILENRDVAPAPRLLASCALSVGCSSGASLEVPTRCRVRSTPHPAPPAAARCGRGCR